MSLTESLPTKEDFCILLRTGPTERGSRFDGSFLDQSPPPGLWLSPNVWSGFCQDVGAANMKLSREQITNNCRLGVLLAAWLLLDNFLHTQWVLLLLFIGINLLFVVQMKKQHETYARHLKDAIERLHNRQQPSQRHSLHPYSNLWNVQLVTKTTSPFCFTSYYARFLPKALV